MKILKLIILFVFIACIQSTVAYMSEKTKNNYNSQIEQIFTKFEKQNSGNDLAKQSIYYNKIKLKVSVLLNKKLSENNKFVLNLLNDKLNEKVNYLDKKIKQSELIKKINTKKDEKNVEIQSNQEQKIFQSNLINPSDNKIVIDYNTPFNQKIKDNPEFIKFFNIINENNSVIINENDKLIFDQFDKNKLLNRDNKEFYSASKDELGNYWLYIFNSYYNLDEHTVLSFKYKKPEEISNYYFAYIDNGNNLNLLKNKIIFFNKNLTNKYKITNSDLNNLSKYIALDFHFDNKNLDSRILFFNELEKLTNDIIQGKQTNEDKIRVIYDWINKNIQYDYSKRYESHSGMMTFLNKKGVCDGISQLFIYMIRIAGIQDNDIISGLQMTNFNPDLKENHAWVRIGDSYYDPTFDIGNRYKYKYFNLPKDLFYADRIEDSDSKFYEYYNYSKLQLNEIMDKNYFSFVDKYKNNNFEILKTYTKLKSKGIEKVNNFSYEDLKKLSKSYIEVENIQDIYNYFSSNSITYFRVELEKTLFYIDSFDLENKILFYNKADNDYFIVRE